jgi:hypothetical protein
MVDGKTASTYHLRVALFLGLIGVISWNDHGLAAATPSCKPPSFPPQTQLCSNGLSGYVNKRVLISKLLDTCQIVATDIAPKGDITYDKEVSAVRDFATFCATPGNCSDSATNDLRIKLGQVEGDLRSFAGGRAISIGTNKVKITYSTSVENFLQSSPDASDAMCVAVNDGGVSPPPKPPESSNTGAFAIRKNITDLPVNRDDPKFKGLDKGSISVNDDYVNTKLGVNVDIAAGYTFAPVVLGQSSQVSFTPFAYYHEQYVASKKASEDQQIYNIAAGFLSTWELTNLGIFQFAPKYVHAIQADGDIESANLYYTPPITVAGIGTAAKVPFTNGLVYYRFAPLLQVTYGDVSRASTKISPLSQGSFGWLGPNLSLYLYGAGPLEGFSYISSFVYLTDFAGQRIRVARYENSLNYSLSSDDTWSLQLKYVYGPDLDTLQQQKMLTLGLGLKY